MVLKMADYKKKIIKLSKGQISSDLIERTDIALLDDSGQTVNNFINSKYGLLQTTKGTQEVLYLNGKSSKMFRLNKPSGEDVLFIINATLHQFVVMDCTGTTIGELYFDGVISEDNLSSVRIIQNNDTIVMVSKGNPLYTFSLSDNGTISDFGVFKIDLDKVLRVSTLDKLTVNPVFFRMSRTDYPLNPFEFGIGIGDYVEVSATGEPSVGTVNVKKFIGMSDSVAEWEDTTYTPKTGDYCLNLDNVYYVYSNNKWSTITSYDDTHYGNTWRCDATAGHIKATLSGSIVITKPASYVGTPEQFAKKLLMGCDFDGEENVGLFKIDDIQGSTSGDNYNINSLSGMTYITMWKANTNFNGFTIKLSQKPAFDVDKVGTVDNIFGTSNFPLNAFFYQQRLFIVGSEQDTTQIVASQIGTFNDFSDDYSGSAANAFQLKVAGTEKETIQNVVLNQGLQIFTDKGEWIIGESVITSSSGFTRNSTIGSKDVKPVISANGITLFSPKNGVGLVGFIYNFQTASFSTPTISILTDVFTSATVDMMVKKAYSSQDDTLIYICLEDGTLVIGNYLSDQDIQSFITKKSETTKYIQTIQVENEVFYLVDRGGSGLWIVIEDEKKKSDSVYTWQYDSSTGLLSSSTARGDVNIYGKDGRLLVRVKDFNGEYQFPAPYPEQVTEFGYNIHSTFESNPIAKSAETFDVYKTLRSAKLALTPTSNPEFLTVNGKRGVNKNNFVSYYHLTRPTRKCIFKIENDVYPVQIMSITLEYEA